MLVIASLLAGLVFGLGLIVSGMANPAKVLGFLNLAGPWDPSLALVMAGAIAVGLVAFHLARKRSTSLLGRLGRELHFEGSCSVVGHRHFGLSYDQPPEDWKNAPFAHEPD